MPNPEESFTKIDVPADGSCLFWAVTLAYLTPVKDDAALFQQRYETLFGNEETAAQNLDRIRNLVQNYNIDDTFAGLVRSTFRSRVVDHIRSHEDEFRAFVTGDFNDYLNNMRSPNTWGGEPEIKAMSEMLGAGISVSGASNTHYNANSDVQMQLFHVGTPGARNHYNFGLEQGIVNDNEVGRLQNSLEKSTKHYQTGPQDFELVQLLIQEADSVTGADASTSTHQKKDFESFQARFQSYIDQVPSYLHSVKKPGFFSHFFLGSFSTLLDTEVAKKLDIGKIYFDFDSAKTLKVAVIKNGEINSQKDVVDKVKLFVISESGSRPYTQEFDQGELQEVLGEHYSLVENNLGEIKVKFVEINKDNINDQGISVTVEDKKVDTDHTSERQFTEIKKGLWNKPEDDIAKLAVSDEQIVRGALEKVLEGISTIHSEYESSLEYASSAREAAHHGFIAGALNNFRYRHNLRVYLEQFAGRGYADIVLLVRGTDRALNSVPIIIELKAGRGPSLTPDKALEQAEKYAQGFQPNVQRVLTTSGDILCVGVNLDYSSPISNIEAKNREGEIIPLFQDMLKSTDDWDMQRIDKIELKKQIKDNLERIYHTFPGTPEKGDNHYFSRFLLGQSLLLNEVEDLKTKFEKHIFIYDRDENIPTEIHPESGRPQRPAARKAKGKLSTGLDASHAIVSMVLIPKSTEKLVYVINIVEANRKNVLDKVLPLDRLSREIGDRKIVELNLNFDTRYKLNFKRYLTVEASDPVSLEQYNERGIDEFQGTFREVPYPDRLKETFDKALDSQHTQSSVSEYNGLFKKIGEGIWPFKTLVGKENDFQGVLNGAFSYYSDFKLQEPPETRALVLTEFQTGRGERIDMLVHGIKFAGQDGNAKEYTPIGLELKASRQGKGAQALLRKANDQINEEYKEGVTYKTLTDGDEVKFIGVVFDKGAKDANSLVLASRTSKEGFIPVKVVHSSTLVLPTVGQCSKKRKKRNIGMACVDSRDEESIEEQEREKERIKELFDTDEVRERVKSVEFYSKFSKTSERISQGIAADLEDFIKKVRGIDPSAIDSEIRDIVTEIKGKVSEEKVNEEEIKDILRRSGAAEKISKVAGDAGLTYGRFLDDGRSKSQNVINKINSNPEVMNHLNRMGRISSLAMQGMMYKNLIGDILSGNLEGVAINLVFIAGSPLLSKLAEVASAQGSKFVLEGKVFFGQTLRMASPFLARVTSAFIVYDLINQIKDLEAGNKDAVIGIAGDGIVLIVDVAGIGVEIAEVAGILEGFSSITGPIGATIGAVVFIGTDIYLAVKTVEKEDKIIHLTGWEKFEEGLREFLHMGPSGYLEELIKEKQANNQLVKNAIEFLRNNTNIQRYIFPSSETYEKLVTESLRRCIGTTDSSGNICRGHIESYEVQRKEVATRISLDNNAFLDKKRTGIKWSRASPDNLDEGELFCSPTDLMRFLPGSKDDYLCYNAIGLSYSANRTGNDTLIALGKGKDTAAGFKNSPNIFLVENGHKEFTGGNENNTFILLGNGITGVLNGGSGSNTIDLTEFAPDEDYINVKLVKSVYRKGSVSLSSGRNTLRIENMHTILGRDSKQDKVECDCSIKYIDTNGGKSDENPDHIIMTGCYAPPQQEIVVRSNTIVNNLVHSNNGNFDYIILPGEGKANINIQFDYVPTKREKHNFLFHYTLSNLINVDIQNVRDISFRYNTYSMVYTVRSITFSFESDNKKFDVYISDIPVSATYKLLGDNTEIKIGDKDSLYALQNTDKPTDEIIRSYPVIANRLNMTIAVKSNNESVTVGHGKHEVLYNHYDLSSHLVGNGGENTYIMASILFNYLVRNVGEEGIHVLNDIIPFPEVNIYNADEGSSMDTLDLRSLTKEIKDNSDKHSVQLKASQEGSDLLVELGVEIIYSLRTRLVFPVRLKNGTQWYQKLHIILNNAPMQLERSGDNWNLSPVPLIFDENIKIAVITAKDIEEGNRLIIYKQIGEYTFSRMRDDLIVSSLGKGNAYTVLLSNFYQEPKMETLSIEFNDTMISLQEEMDEVNSAMFFCPKVLQIDEKLSVNGGDLLNHYDCLKFASDEILFLRSSNNLLLLSDKGALLIPDYYSYVREKWNLPVELSDSIVKPEEFRERADNPSFFRYYQPDERGLQIYHNQPTNDGEIGFIDLRDRSILDFDMKVVNSSLLLSHKNNTLTRIENWNTYQPAREMIFAFDNAMIPNLKCMSITCNQEGDIIEKFRKERSRVRIENDKPKTATLRVPLYVYAKEGNLNSVKLSLVEGTDIEAKDSDGGTALYLAAREGHLDIVRLLFNWNTDIETKENSDWTPLHAAVYYGRLDVVEFLLDKGVDINAKNNDGRTPLHLAAYKGELNIAKVLFNQGANILAKDQNGKTPPSLAIQENKPEIEEFLRNKHSYTLLHYPIKEGKLHLVKLRLDKGADIEAKGEHGNTPLHFAVMYDKPDIARFLVDRGANIEAKGKHDNTPLHFAAKEGRSDMVTLFLNRNANIEVRNEHGNTPLHMAIKESRLGTVVLLLDRGADIEAKGGHGNTPLHFAIVHNNLDTIRLLMDRGADIEAKGKHDNTPLHFAAKEGRSDIVTLLLDRGANINAKNSSGKTLLEIADSGIVKLLVNKKDRYGYAPLHYAAKEGNLSLFNLTIGKNADIDIEGDYGGTPLYFAIREGKSNVVKFLLNNGANISAEEEDGITLLHYAIRLTAYNDSFDIVKLLIDKKDKYDYTALHYAVQEGKLELVTFLINNDADIEARTNDGKTPLHLATINNHLDVVKFLLNRGADIDAKDNDGWTPLHFVAYYGDVQLKLAALLVEKGADIEAKTDRDWESGDSKYKKGSTPLDAANISGRRELAALLSEKKAQENSDWSPLHYAAKHGKKELATFMVENGANIEAKDKDGKTSLDVARENSKLEVVRLLEEEERRRNGEGRQRIKRHHGIIQELSLGNIASRKLKELNSEVLNELLAQFKCLVHQQSGDFQHNKEVLQRILQESKGIEPLIWLIVREYSILSLEYPDRTRHLLLKDLDQCFNTVINRESIGHLVEHLEHDDVVPRVEEFINRVKLEGKISNNLQQQELSRQLPVKEVKDSAAKPVYLDELIDTGDSLQNDEIDYNKGGATSGAVKPSSWINGLFSWVKDSVGGLFSSQVALPGKSPIQSLPKESTSNSKPKVTTLETGLSQVDVNGTILLLDTFIRKITGQKYISTADQPMSLLEARGYALNITERFEQVLNEAAIKSGISAISLNFNPVAVQSAIVGQLRDGKFSEISKTLYSSAKQTCPEFKQTEKFLSRLKTRIEEFLDKEEKEFFSIGSKREIEEAKQVHQLKLCSSANFVTDNSIVVSLASVSRSKSQLPGKAEDKPRTCLNDPTVNKQLQRSL